MNPRIKRIARWAVVATAAGGVALATVAWAGHGSRGHGGPGFGGMGMGFGPMRELLADLDLSDEQKARLRTIARNGWEASATKRAQLDSIRKQIDASITANGFNEAEVRALVDSGTPVMAELMVDVVRGLADMRAVLTPEQQQLFDTERARLEQERAERRARREARRAGDAGST